MIVKENIEIGGKDFVKQYSDGGLYIERDGEKYSEAIDLSEFGRIYTETDIPIDIEPSPIDEDIVQKAEAYNYLTGQDNNIENKILNMYTNVKEWKDPKDSENPYNKGDKCYYKEQFWVSTIDNNISEPGSLTNTWINI